MKKRIYTAIGLATLLSAAATAQSAYDAYNLLPTQLRGTARFVGMGGAFTSLGGDISSMTQNPAGLGLYRSSDIGLTFDISPRSYKTATNFGSYKENETRANFDNFGYVGVANFGGVFRALQWGVSYNRVASYDRITSGHVNPAPSSLSNYVASYTDGVNSGDLLPGENYDPYYDPAYYDNQGPVYMDWLSILSYQAFMMSNTAGSDTKYAGLGQNGTVGDALFRQRERGYIDEYNIDLACNINDIVFLGMGVGIYDLSKTIESNYSESLAGALVYDKTTDALRTGNAGFGIANRQHISGSGANFKFGVVVRPIEMLRIGAAIHTPTYLRLTHSGYADAVYTYTPDGGKTYSNDPANIKYVDKLDDALGTPEYSYKSRLNTPWRFMIGASAVIGSKFILSADYERVAYPDMKLKEENYSDYDYDYDYGWSTGGYTDNKLANADVKKYFQAANIVRIGAEYRVLPFMSVRAGYNWQGSAVKSETYNGGTTVYTSGTNPAYTFDGDTQNFCLGVGFRVRSWYIDLAYQHTRQSAVYRAFTPYDGIDSPSASITRNYNNIVVSTGFRF
ncbi:MAG: outer membrane protein transport protein [Muribaculaceae bacterium]|nr:outer membrane protein transport protein [Muribaculaceae bacterium]